MQSALIENWISVLHKCRLSKDLARARCLRGHLRQQGLETHPVLGNYLVPVLVSCGSVPDARQVFESLPSCHRNLHSWNCLISGYTNYGCPLDALHLFYQMQQHPLPDTITYLAALGACSKLTDIDEGRAMHAAVVSRGLESDGVIGNTLIDMYIKCGSLAEAQHSFNSMSNHDVISWNVLIAGYANCGSVKETRNCFSQMCSEGVSPDIVSHVCSLKACCSSFSLECGQELHAEIVMRGFAGDLHLCNMLVAMYGKCGSIAEAVQVFDSMHIRDIVTWNALITIYVDSGLSKRTSTCFRKMQMEGICPNRITFVSVLKACNDLELLQIGQEIHAETTKSGLEMDLYIGSTLVVMYTECKCPREAWLVFETLPVRSAVTWNAVIAGYAKCGCSRQVKRCFQQLQLEGIAPDCVTFFHALDACISIQDLDIGQMVHTEITKRGLEVELVVSSSLVAMYAECGLIQEARVVFDKLSNRDLVTCNVLIAGYADKGMDTEAVKCFGQMMLEGISPHSDTFLCAFKACRTVGAVNSVHELHAEATKRGLERELFVGNLLVNVYGKCDLPTEASTVFDRLQAKDAISWSALISGHAQHGSGKDVGTYLQKMYTEAVSLDSSTFALGLKVCGLVGFLQLGIEMHVDITKWGLERELYVGSAVVDMYGKCGLLAEAECVFNKLPVRSVVSWTSMIQAFGMNHKGSEAVHCFKAMLEQDVTPTSLTFVCALASCSHCNMTLEGEECFAKMKDFHIEPNMDHYASMVDLYARSGLVYEAERLIASMRFPPSSMILYDLLSACKVYGKVEIGERCFRQLLDAHEGDSSAFAMMIDLYASAGQWDDANRLEELRKSSGAKKKPGIASIEVNKTIHDFVVGTNKSANILDLLDNLASRIKAEAFIHDLESAHMHDFDERVNALAINQ